MPTFQKKHFRKWCRASSYMWTCVFNRIVIIHIKMYFAKSDVQENSFNPALLMIWHLRKVVPRPEVLSTITSNAFTDSVTLCRVILSFLNPFSYYNALKGSKVRKQSTVGKRKHITVMIPLNCGIIMRFKNGKKWREVMASCSVGLSTVLWYIEMGGSVMVIYGISWKCKGPFQ